MRSIEMTKSEVQTAIFDFLGLVEHGRRTVEENEECLAFVLDKLALALHYSEYPFDNRDYPDPPEKNYKEVRAIVEKRFPNYGYYNLPHDVTNKIAETDIVVGDAIDDITDIFLDMQEIGWRWQNTSDLDALWYFRSALMRHWTDHLRGLQFYLNARYYEE